MAAARARQERGRRWQQSVSQVSQSISLFACKIFYLIKNEILEAWLTVGYRRAKLKNLERTGRQPGVLII